MAQSFLDLNEKKWNYTLNNRTIREISIETGINLVNIALADRNLNSLFDMLFINQALYVCCKASAKESKIKFSEFENALEVPYFPDIQAGFMEELQNFFHRTGQVQLAKAIGEVRTQFLDASTKEIEESPNILAETKMDTPTTSESSTNSNTKSPEPLG